MRGLVFGVLFSFISAAQAMPRELMEHAYFHQSGHDVSIDTFRDAIFWEIDVSIDGDRVLRLNSIPENMVQYSFNKIRSKLDGLIADYEENGILHYFGGVGVDHEMVTK